MRYYLTAADRLHCVIGIHEDDDRDRDNNQRV